MPAARSIRTNGAILDGMFEGFTGPARIALMEGHQEAHRGGFELTGTQHILYGVFTDAGVAEVFAAVGVTQENVRRSINRQESPTTFRVNRWESAAKQALEVSLGERLNLGDAQIGVEHLSLAVTNRFSGGSADVLRTLGAELSTLRSELLRLLGHAASAEVPPWPVDLLMPTFDSPELAALSGFSAASNPIVEEIRFEQKDRAIVSIAFALHAARYRIITTRRSNGWAVDGR